jgi:hypothetical protein
MHKKGYVKKSAWKLHNFYSSLRMGRVIESKSMRLAGHVERLAEIRNAYKFFVTKPEAERSL